MTCASRVAGIAAGLVAVVSLSACASPSDGLDTDDADAARSASPSVEATPLGLRYVALGDSFTSAPGVGDSTGPVACFRTDGNYPHLLADRLGLQLTDVSCAGATSRDLRSPQRGADVRPQLDAVTPETDLVSLSIGANDAGLFGALATQCAGLGTFGEGGQPQGASCTGSDRFAESRLGVELSALARETVRSVRAIRQRAPEAKVVVVGYPQLVPESGTCEVLPVAAADVPFVREVNRRLADALERGARAAGVEYVDMWAASAGHDACGAEPWVAGLRPVGPGAPLHPYPAHQSAVADALARLVG
ncbi:MAG: SGNH/GDSL hydrolase family protein [Propionibacteriales bacterium]|nr:SGNH/GDSL hydrolase family protein [Propionibacteriales bacterium]